MASFKTVVRDALFGGLIAGSGVTSTLLASTRSRRNYDDLDAILWELDDGRITPEVQMEVRRHARQCDPCQESKRGLTSPTKILRSFAPTPPPVDYGTRSGTPRGRAERPAPPPLAARLR